MSTRIKGQTVRFLREGSLGYRNFLPQKQSDEKAIYFLKILSVGTYRALELIFLCLKSASGLNVPSKGKICSLLVKVINR